MAAILGIYASQISGHLYAGPYGAYDALASVTLSADAASITFSGIPNTYKHLQLRGLLKSNSGGGSLDLLTMNFNSDTTASNYAYHRLYGNGSSVFASGATSTNYLTHIPDTTGSNTNTYGVVVADILDYANTSKNKVVRAIGGFDDNGTSTGYVDFNSLLWQNSTDAINSITVDNLFGNFRQYSSLALYGVK